MKPFQVAYHTATPHGVLCAVHLPDSPEPVPEDVLALLPAAEASHARTLGGYRQVQFTGGRIALRRAAERLGFNAPPFLSTPRGAPVVPAGWVASVSHKRTLAVGMVARSQEGTLGVDIEDYEPRRLSVARSVLTTRELTEVEPLPEDRRWMATLVRFSIKESIYKALDPYVQRYVGFKEAEVDLQLDGLATVRLFLTGGEGPFETDARYQWLEGRLLTSARIRRR